MMKPHNSVTPTGREADEEITEERAIGGKQSPEHPELRGLSAVAVLKIWPSSRGVLLLGPNAAVECSCDPLLCPWVQGSSCRDA